jgi:predicted dehydrogenase
MAEGIRVGMIGTGGIARRHAQGLKKFEDVEFVGHADIDAGRAVAMADAYGGRGFGNVAEMLDATEPDAVWVCIPPFAHGPAEWELIKRGIPFLTEKPQHISLDDAEEIAEAIEDADLLAAVGYMNRYRRSVERGRELIDENPPALIHGAWIGGIPGVSWWRVKTQSGGQLLEQTTHIVDLLRYIAGEAESVYALGAQGFVTDVPDYDVEDASSAVIRMKNGAVANIMSSCTSRIRAGGVHLTLVARDLFVEYSGWNNDVVIHKSALEKELIQGEENIFELEDRAFMDAVKSGDPSSVRCTYADGLETLRLCLAINDSMATGQPVFL